MKNMSFSKTIPQMRARTKTVTRRKAWNSLKAGDRVQAVEKSMGLKRGERVIPIAVIEIVDVRQEPIYSVTYDDIRREGFPELTHSEFVTLVCHVMKCKATDMCNRIEFMFVDALKETGA